MDKKKAKKEALILERREICNKLRIAFVGGNMKLCDKLNAKYQRVDRKIRNFN